MRGAASAASFSLFFSMSAAIYLLLRQDVDEATFDQIADLCGKSRAAVFRLYQQSLTHMRKQLESPCKNLKN